MENRQLLKKDLFGEVWRVSVDDEVLVVRDTRAARWWLASLSRALLRREARALSALHEISAIPKLLSQDRSQLVRSYLTGTPLHESTQRASHYFSDAMQLLRRLHRRGVAHNDLAKEPNVLVLEDGTPAFIDFQLASHAPQRGRLFRIAAREDIRHLLKHKRSYRPDLLTARELAILDNPSVLSRLWMSLCKPVYLLITRRWLGWADREGAADR